MRTIREQRRRLDHFPYFDGHGFYYVSENGNFTERETGSWYGSGTYMFCIWIAGSESDPVTRSAKTSRSALPPA